MNKDRKEINKSLNILARSAVILFAGILLSKIFSYIYRIMVARIYGPDIYGVFLLAHSIIWILVFTSLMGFDSGIVRYIPLYNAKNKKRDIKFLISFGLKSTLIFGAILGCLIFFLSGFISLNLFNEPRLEFFLKIFSILVPIIAVTSYLLAIINGYEKIGWFSFIENIWKSVANVIFLIFLILIGFGVNSVPLSYLIAGISTLIISFIIVNKYTPFLSNKSIKNLEKRKKKIVRKEFINFSLPLVFFNIISVFMGWIDSFSIGYFKGVTEVGIYNAATPIALILYIAPQLFTKLFLPMISREYGYKKIEVIKQLTQQVGKWILLINIPIFLILFMFPEKFIDLLFGNKFITASTSLRILLIGTLLLSVSRVSNRLLTMVGKTKIILLDIVIAVIVNLILNSIFVPMPVVFGIENSSGINGAAIATTIASILIGLLFFIQARTSLSIVPLRKKMLNIIFAGFISISIILIISKLIEINKIVLILISFMFFLIYLSLVFIFKGFDNNDLLIIKKFNDKLKLSKSI